MTRTVTLVVLALDGEIIGETAAFDVGTPWWQEVGEIVAAVRHRYGLELDVLRLLSAERNRPPGGAVSYLTQARGPVPNHLDLGPVQARLIELVERDEPLRAPYARAGGAARSLAWATEIVGPGTAVQQRTWNLSAIWRLEAERGTFWLKQLPAWLRCEPAALRWLGEVLPELAPPVIAFGEEGRELLADVPGVDQYEADLPTRLLIQREAHRFQRAASADLDRLLADGIQDRRGPALARWIRASLQGWDPAPAGELLANLDERMAAIADCGLPDTLGHGDASPGNVRGHGAHLVFLDWSECYLGHPGFDLLGLVGGLPADAAQVVLEAWAADWRRDVPGCDPIRAIELLRPVNALRSAAVYAGFLAEIEPSEHPYHALDVPEQLAAAMTDF